MALTSFTGEAFAGGSGHHGLNVNSGNTYGNSSASITQISYGGNTSVNGARGTTVQGGNLVTQTAVISQNSPIAYSGSRHQGAVNVNSGSTYGNSSASITQISAGGNTSVNGARGTTVQGGNQVSQTAVIIQNSPIGYIGGNP